MIKNQVTRRIEVLGSQMSLCRGWGGQVVLSSMVIRHPHTCGGMSSRMWLRMLAVSPPISSAMGTSEKPAIAYRGGGYAATSKFLSKSSTWRRVLVLHDWALLSASTGAAA